MADRWAVATGNWSSTATWNGGTLPTAADDVFADGFTVTIDQNITVLSIRTTQRTGGTAGGGFILNAGFNVTANVTAGTTTCLTRNATGAASTITGNITGGSANPSAGFTNNAASTTNIIGNIITTSGNTALQINAGTVNMTGTTVHSQNGYCIQLTGSSTLNITGNISGGAYNYASTINLFGNPVFLTINGNLTASSGNFAGIWCPTGLGTITINGNLISTGGTCIYGTTNHTVIVNGNSTASNTSACIYNTKLVIVNGNCYSSSNGTFPIGAGFYTSPSQTLEFTYVSNNNGSPGALRSFYTGGVNVGHPAITNVRQGIVFGGSNEFTGTLIVPSAQFVSLGTPVDSGVGTLQYLTMADLQAALAPNAPVIAERSDDDTKALTFSWPVSGVPVSGFKSFDNGAYSSVSGAISYLRTEGARHYYTLAYNAADRSTQESLIRYRMQDGTYTKYFNLRIMPATNSEVIAIKAKTDNLPADPASSSQITSLLNNAPMEAF